MSVGGDALDIQSIQLNLEELTYAESIQIWDEGGAYVDGYAWLSADDFGESAGGWTQDYATKSELALTDSMNVVVYLDDNSEGGTLTIAGEVPAVTQEIPLHGGFNYIGNSTPATIDIQDLQLTIAYEDLTYAESIQVWDNGGAYVDGFAWLGAEDFGESTGGWTQDYATKAEFAIAPGQGVVIYMPDDYEGSDFVTIASPLPETK